MIRRDQRHEIVSRCLDRCFVTPFPNETTPVERVIGRGIASRYRGSGIEKNRADDPTTGRAVVFRLDVFSRRRAGFALRLHLIASAPEVEPAAFQQVARGEFQKAPRAMVLLNQAVKLLDDVRASRAEEASLRWRANYDLVCAQCLAYRVRLFQFLLALDQHTKAAPFPKTSTNNCWNVVRRREMLPPDDEQVLQTNVDLKELGAQEQRARGLFQLVLTEHPGTPWARRAEYELATGFGMIFAEGFSDPRYAEVGKTIKLPKF